MPRLPDKAPPTRSAPVLAACKTGVPLPAKIAGLKGYVLQPEWRRNAPFIEQGRENKHGRLGK